MPNLSDYKDEPGEDKMPLVKYNEQFVNHQLLYYTIMIFSIIKILQDKKFTIIASKKYQKREKFALFEFFLLLDLI